MYLISPTFLKINGFFLTVLGLAMLVLRLRDREEFSSFRRWIGALWSVVCMGTGVVLVLMGFRLISQPGEVLSKKQSPVVSSP